MSTELSPVDRAKRAAALCAAGLVEPGMRVGLGTGSTAAWLVKCLGVRQREEGLTFQAVPTSSRTAAQAREEGITLTTLDDAGSLDLTIDGADEFDADFALIKGGGGALLQEKIVAAASDRMVVIADAEKRVSCLGAFPLPVEVIAFGGQSTRRQIEALIASMDVACRDTSLRMSGETPYVTDEGNHILDLHLQRIGDARALAAALNQIPGVVENGLFIDLCDTIVVGDPSGATLVEHLGADGDPSAPDNLFAD